METTSKRIYRNVTPEYVATRVQAFYRNIFRIIISGTGLIAKSVIENREYTLTITDKDNSYADDHYTAVIKPIKKGEDSLDELLTDIMERNLDSNFYLSDVIIKTHEYECRKVSVKKRGYAQPLQQTVHIYTEHKQYVDFFVNEKLAAFLSAKKLSLVTLKKVVKALDKVENDGTLKNYVSCWKELDNVFNPTFVFRKYSLKPSDKFDGCSYKLIHKNPLKITIHKQHE